MPRAGCRTRSWARLEDLKHKFLSLLKAQPALGCNFKGPTFPAAQSSIHAAPELLVQDGTFQGMLGGEDDLGSEQAGLSLQE